MVEDLGFRVLVFRIGFRVDRVKGLRLRICDRALGIWLRTLKASSSGLFWGLVFTVP